MSYLITARKWRPTRFEEVVGQEHITRTIKNALLEKKTSQSYLFSGPRGVGKTTLARIYAKFINCDRQAEEGVAPCGTCSFCKEVDVGNSINYQEIDGASNRGIEQIREINRNLHYTSPQGKYRLFVIDEVHMLTIEAFNALLKSLEEPPEKVVFIFCTTESHKVPKTILSRCQQYFFKGFNIPTLQKQLETILIAEKISFEEQAIFQIAKAADGSMRDAQNILDQVIAYMGANITLPQTLEVLGKTSLEFQKIFIENLSHKNLIDNKKLLSQFFLEGKEITLFLYELIAKFSLMIYLGEGLKDNFVLNVSAEEITIFSELQKKFSPRELFLLNDICFDFMKELKATSDKQVIVEFFLIKLHRYSELITPEEIKSELIALSKQVKVNDKDEELKEKQQSDKSMVQSTASMVAEVFEGKVVSRKKNNNANNN